MVEHPCINGLSPACFKFFPDWVKQALAYKLLNVILPKKILPLLMAGLESPLIGPGSTLPGGVELPPGSIVPPDFLVPESWIPWFNMIFTTDEDPRKLFPIDWAPGDLFPRGVELSKDYVLPSGWTPENPPNPFYLPGYSPFPTPQEDGAAPPLFVGAWEPGPGRRPAPGPGVSEKTISIDCNGVEQLTSASYDWDTVRNSTLYANYLIITDPTVEFIKALYIAGNYNITRTVFRFPLNDLPVGGNVTSGYVSIKLDSGPGPIATTQRAPTTFWGNIADFLFFEGDPNGVVTLAFGENKFNLTSDSLVYVQTNAGGVCYFISREYSHDFLDSPTPEGEMFVSSCFTQYAADPDNRQTLVLTYLP